MGNEAQEVTMTSRIDEEVVRRNIIAMKNFNEDTRKMVREFEKQIIELRNTITTQNQTIEQQRLQISGLQQRVYSGSTG